MFLTGRKEGKRENSSKIKGMQQIRLQMNANGEDIYISIYIYIYIKNTYSLVCLWPQEGVWHLWTRQFLEEETHSSFHRCRPEKTTMEKLSESMYFWSESINVQTTHTDLWARRNSCSDGLRCCQFWVFGRSWDRKKDNTSYNYNTMIPLMKIILQTVCAHKRSTSIFVIHLSWLSVIKLHSKQPSSHDFILAFFVLVEAGSNHT